MSFITYQCVVPLAGTWIETIVLVYDVIAFMVVPLAGTWIETVPVESDFYIQVRRSPCGNVD